MCAQNFTCEGDNQKLEITAPELPRQKLSPNLISEIQILEEESKNDQLSKISE